MRIKVIEVLGAVTLLTLTGLCGIANTLTECEPDVTARETSVAYITWEFKNLLQLDAHQVQEIKKINYDFYDDISKLYDEIETSNDDKINSEIRHLLSNRTIKIMTVLTEKQKTIWNKVHLQFEQKFLATLPH